MQATQRETAVSIPLTPTRSDLYWRRIFNKYDRDNDGRISYVELKNIIESREYDHDLPDNVVEKIMALADRDNSGYLEFAEFVEMMHNPALKAVFGHFVARYVHSIIPHRGPIDTTGARRTQNIQQVLRLETDVSTNIRTIQTPRSRPNVRTRSKAVFTYTDGTYEEEYSCWPPAISMIIISLVEIVLFCYDEAQGKTAATGPIAKLFLYNPRKRHEAWRFLTYMLVHVNVVHLLVNLLVQLFLGVPLEMVHKWWRVVLVYLAGVAAGSLATSLADPKVYLAGASGGVYALITAHIATIIMNWAEMEFAIIQLLVFVLLAGVDVGTAVYDRYWKQTQQNIGYVAHLGGAVAGLLVGIGVLRNLEKRKWEKRLWWAAVILYFSLMIAGILANIFWESRFL
ncbi:rhomboid-related protein 2 isoform X1 [Pieris napi]|uniref:rhomboid-related protein 2 isoform X1 n=1 Tax=Pieris napi TaxID=78633 RepID=UPI001FBA0DF5|nr:rhomboid-related protein 2 isoform X1 [Pieris napi]